MLRDASHQQVIQKFSFIESLNVSRGIAAREEPFFGETIPQPDLERAFNFVPQVNSKSLPPASISSPETAIVANFVPPGIPGELIPYSSSLGNKPSSQIVDGDRATSHNYLGKILFALACSYSLFVAWWLFGHQGSRVLTWIMGGKQIVLSRSDAEFLDYMERSLDTIERKLAAEESEAESEKVVYVPVYTPSATPPSMPLATIPQTQAVPESPSEALKIPTPPPLPEPTPLPPPVEAPVSTPQATPQVAITSNQPKINHTLIGILELGGAKSAALIKVDGTTRRFWEGETIGNSNWVLESVNNQTATISQQGQTRSLAVGETF